MGLVEEDWHCRGDIEEDERRRYILHTYSTTINCQENYDCYQGWDSAALKLNFQEPEIAVENEDDFVAKIQKLVNAPSQSTNNERPPVLNAQVSECFYRILECCECSITVAKNYYVVQKPKLIVDPWCEK